MAQRTVCFRSNAGTDFSTEHDALQDDLRHFIQGITNNPGIARDITTAMVAALQPRYGAVKGVGEEPPVEFDGIACLIARLAETKPAVDPQLPFGDGIAPGRVMLGDPVKVLTDVSGKIAGVTRIGPVPNSVKASFVEPLRECGCDSRFAHEPDCPSRPDPQMQG